MLASLLALSPHRSRSERKAPWYYKGGKAGQVHVGSVHKRSAYSKGLTRKLNWGVWNLTCSLSVDGGVRKEGEEQGLWFYPCTCV